MRLPAFLLRTILAAGLSAACASAYAQDAKLTPEPPPVKPPPPIETPPTPEARLSTAVSTYQANDLAKAQVLLAELANDESYTKPSLRQQARVYLAEVLYRQQDQEAARRVFERVLTLDPSFRIDPFRHPPDVCGFFETIRAYIQPPKNPKGQTSGPVPPLPSLGYMGFGLYQLKHGRSAVGSVMLSIQTPTGVVSLIEFANLLDDRSYDPEIPSEREALVRRRAVEWGSTAVFYGVWGWGILDAGRHWRANVNIQPAPVDRNRLKPNTPPGIQLQVSGRFR